MEAVTGWDERAHQVRVACAIGLVFGLLFAVFNLLTPGQLALGLTELAAVLLLVAPAALLSRNPLRIGLAENLLLLSAAVIFGALILFGGVEGTGLYWAYTVPFLAFFLKGQRLGWMCSTAFLLLVAAYFLAGGPGLALSYHYSPVSATHFVLSLGFYTLVAAAFNQVRNRYETQLATRRDQAEAASLAKSRFLAAASHDLRQPAHALGLFVARLSQLPHEPATAELVAGVDASVRALQEMLDAFFDYSRLDAPALALRRSSFPAQQVLDQLHTSFAAMASERGLRLRIRSSSLWLHSDPVLLHRVLLNLLSNAVQNTPAGTVLVTCRATGGHTQARFEVWDSGVGIAPEDHQRVFQEFVQINNPQRDRGKGLGLGLSLVERACRVLGHPLSLRSALGRGTRVGVLLPLVPTPAIQLPKRPPEFTARTELSGLHVLLIEDDALGGLALAGLLHSWGCRVSRAVDGQAACALIKQLPAPDFVLSDYRLPGLHNGIDSIRLLRQRLGVVLPACVISGDTEAGVRQQVQAAGLVLLQKPVRPAKLRVLLRHALPATGQDCATV